MRSGSRAPRHTWRCFAIESSRPADSRLFHDPLAVAFLDRRLRLAAVMARLPSLGRLVPWYIDRRWPGPRPSGVVRTRAVDDAVRRGPGRGVRSARHSGNRPRHPRLPSEARLPALARHAVLAAADPLCARAARPHARAIRAARLAVVARGPRARAAHPGEPRRRSRDRSDDDKPGAARA